VPSARKSALTIRLSGRRILIGLGSLVSLGLVGAGMFAWLGIYNVAASVGHFYVVDRILRFGMENSVKARAPDIVPPDLTDPNLIRLGAAHYYAGCAYCHGSPDTPISPIAHSMLPPPPDLGGVERWKDQELFWLVRNGLKYTGMPAWPGPSRDEEVWAAVAFLRAMPGMNRAQYTRLALGDVEIAAQSGEEIATGEGPSDAVQACARCHGGGAKGPESDLVPVLHGQPADMMVQALRDYAAGRRPSGIMQAATSGLTEREMVQLATYYAGLTPLRPEGAPGETDSRVERLVAEGDAARNIPGCVQCHDNRALPLYPRLAGQSARYLEGRLTAWRAGLRGTSATDAIMAPIAGRLTPEEISRIAQHFARQPAAGESAVR